jgi:hypothetical protein
MTAFICRNENNCFKLLHFAPTDKKQALSNRQMKPDNKLLLTYISILFINDLLMYVNASYLLILHLSAAPGLTHP